MKVLRVDPLNVYVKQHSILHMNTSNCVKQTSGAWRYYLPRKKNVFMLELRVLQSRIPNTFPPVPETNLKFHALDSGYNKHTFEISFPAMGPPFSTLASEVRNWTGHNGEYSKAVYTPDPNHPANAKSTADPRIYPDAGTYGAKTVTNDMESSEDDDAYARFANWPLSLEFRLIDNRFVIHRKNNDFGTFLLEQKPIEVTGSVLPYLGFSTSQINELASGVGPGERDIVADDFPDLWGHNNDIFVAFPNLPHANHLVWSKEELENVYMILPVGAYGTEEITTYDADRSHMHAVAWTESNSPHTNYIDIKFQKEDGSLIDFNGRSWVLVMQVTYTTQ